ncbi:MAG: family 78 glycoside hydrolase catalytic domain [Planctomycetes bacterium]|nr:family 78 glycoside hydrolase catalytic domain [Planctomycetota bacterium]
MSKSARYAWFNETGLGRNRYAAFRHTLRLKSRNAGGKLHIFADTAYHLYVNGRFIDFGPTRFDPRHPLYDTHDISGHLRQGKNVIAVLVNHYGEVTGRSKLARGGFIAWGTVRDSSRNIPIRTPDGWKAREEPGFDPTAPQFSFPLNPIEVYDQAKGLGRWTEEAYDDSDWPEAVQIAAQDTWGDLEPRQTPFMEGREILPERVVGAGAVSDDEDLWSFRIPFWNERHPDQPKYSDFLFACTGFNAPRDMDIALGLFWGEHWVNGVELTAKRPSANAVCRIDFDVHLKKGWNPFFVKCGAYGDTWDFYLAIPRRSGITVSADRDPASDVLFRVSRPLLIEEYEKYVKPVPLPFTGRETFGGLPDAWREWKRGRTADNPARETDLLITADANWKESPYKVAGMMFRKADFPGGVTVVFDMGHDVLVRPSISVSGVKGATIDMAYSERLRGNRLEMYNHHRTHSADRFRAAQDAVEWAVFHPRGFRYLQCTIRSAPGDVTVHALKGYSAGYPIRDVSWFRCSDPALTKIWELCKRTQRIAMEDAYVDSVLRERGLYGRDTMIQYHNNLACFGDQQLMRRCLDLYIQTMTPDGFIPACVPYENENYLLYDFGMDDVVGFWEYYRYSGDREFAKTAWPAAVKAVEAMRIFEQPSGLLSADKEDMRRPRVVTGYGINHSDNGAHKDHHDKNGISCNFNATWVGAIRAAANLCRVAGEKKKARQLDAWADAIAGKIRKTLWDAGRKLFSDNTKKTHYSVQGNALAALYGVALPGQLPSIRKFLAAELEDNFYNKRDPSGGARMSPAYGYYVLDGVYAAGLPGTAEKAIRRCWGWMLDDGATTAYEFFTNRNSLCHGWSASPVWFLSREVLGIKFPEPGNPNVVRVEPRTESVSWAQGAYPHPRGVIEVRWQRKDGRTRIEVSAPKGVKVIGARKQYQKVTSRRTGTLWQADP